MTRFGRVVWIRDDCVQNLQRMQRRRQTIGKSSAQVKCSVTYNALFNLCVCLFVCLLYVVLLEIGSLMWRPIQWRTILGTYTQPLNSIHLLHGFDGAQSKCCPKVRGEALRNCCPRPKGQLIDCSPRSQGISVLLPNLLYNFYKNNLFATLKFGECCLTQRCFKQAVTGKQFDCFM